MKDPIPAAGHTCDGYIIEVGGKFNSEYGSITEALKAGLELGRRTASTRCACMTQHERTPETSEPPEFHWWMTLVQ